MKVHEELIQAYLHGVPASEMEEHWLFRSMEEGVVLFHPPDPGRRAEVAQLAEQVRRFLKDFRPLNEALFQELHPRWAEVREEMAVLLAVGCPEPYDAMMLEREGHGVVVLDLLRLLGYRDAGMSLEPVLRQLLTHEAAHLCLHATDKIPAGTRYVDRMKGLVFDEGFAHYLAFRDDIRNVDFRGIIGTHYPKSLQRLREALVETDEERQKLLLLQADSGPYWEKFAAISGKLFLAAHPDAVQEIHAGGPEDMFRRMGLS